MSEPVIEISKLLGFAWKKHKGQLDDEGLPYYWAHLWPVYKILNIIAPNDVGLQCAGLLHDTLEDTDTTYEELVENFGEDIANLVHEVTREGEKDDYGYYYPRLHSPRAIILKFADRLSNISRMSAWPPERRAQYLRRSKFWRSPPTED